MDKQVLVEMIDKYLKAVNIKPPDRTDIDLTYSEYILNSYSEDVIINSIHRYFKDKIIDKRDKKQIVLKKYKMSDLWIGTIYKYFKHNIAKDKQQSKNDFVESTNSNKSNKYVEMARKILEEIQLPTTDWEFEKWYQAKARIMIGYAPPAYPKPFANTSLKAKKAIQDKYQKAYAYAIMDAAEKHLKSISNNHNMQNLAFMAFDKDDYDVMNQ